ncbi:hypothetical protein J7T55_014135 [Diaporthe amygdali]|uniref:uncharacterized protein n=1 Tax=Phomopsis amygdali TaxID=1214568 RepID=UPI0022FF1A74|nr:uncharacterized protein J7T55_014135 [Diaporthe amygdali]KAJ0109573.1 hypothetical protein J7T55_014135 [Diaporthe amygdali]
MKAILVLVSLLASAIASPVQVRQLRKDEALSIRGGSPESVIARHLPIARQVIEEIDEDTGLPDFEDDEDNDGTIDSLDQDLDGDGILNSVDPDDDNDGEPDVTDNLDRRDDLDLPDIPDDIDLNPFDKH